MQAKIVKGREPISEEQMYELYNIDRDFRDTAKLKHNNRVTTVKNKEWDIAQTINHQTTIDLKPKYGSLVPQRSVELLETLSNQPRMELYNPQREKEELLWGMLRTDQHLDELDHKNSSFKKRVAITDERTKRALDRLMRFDIDRLLIGQMGDLFNSDKWYRTSSWKVTMQNNIHEKDAFKRVLERTIAWMEEFKKLWIPLEYKIVPWNHDNLAITHYWVACEYALGIPVTVDKDRAYIRRGETLIALWHWDNEKPTNFLQFVVDEFLTKYKQKITHLHWYLGNQHQNIISQNGSMIIKNLLAPNPKSTRTKSKGYDMVQGQHAFVWDKKEWEIAEVRG